LVWEIGSAIKRYIHSGLYQTTTSIHPWPVKNTGLFLIRPKKSANKALKRVASTLKTKTKNSWKSSDAKCYQN
jgi:hypothetical protein